MHSLSSIQNDTEPGREAKAENTMKAGENFTERKPIKMLRADMQEQSRRLQWLPPAETFNVQGIETRGGFFLQPKGALQFSFAVDPNLPVGTPERAEPLHIRILQHLSYARLTADQRARHLHVLARIPLADPIRIDDYLGLQLAGAEWRFLMQPDGEDGIDAAYDFLDPAHLVPARGALNFLSWALQSWSRDKQVGLLEGIYECPDLLRASAALLEQGVANLVAIGKAIGPEVALAVGRVYDAQHRDWEDRSFQNKFSLTWSAMHPSGLSIPVMTEVMPVQYRPSCWELQRAEYIAPQPCWTAQLPVYLRGGEPLFTAIGQVRKAVLAQPRLDPAKLQRLETETSEMQLELSARIPPEQETAPVRELKTQDEPDRRVRAGAAQLITRDAWTAKEFNALARGCGLMPHALRQAVNQWSMTISEEPLLDGEDPLLLNKNIIEVVRRKYE
jgi:hypothetical protein